jgi:hypothetical protein
MRNWLVCCALAGVMVAIADGGRAAQGSPSAGQTDVLPLSVSGTAFSILGETSLVMNGWMRQQRMPADDAGVSELRLTELRLVGASPLGRINVAEQPGAVSRGELRSLDPANEFPASSYLDLYVSATAPDSPFGPLEFHNVEPLRMRATSPIQAWPPLGTAYGLDAVFGVDNDGDGAIDEDTANDDGDAFIDEDRPGPDPDADPWDECGDDADCDGLDGEDPPAALCAPGACDEDGDGLVDEDPNCYPLFGPSGSHLKLALCLRDLTFQIAPGLPAYSVARGGPSQRHPADLYSLIPSPADTHVQPPFLLRSCADLGLSADGCDDGADGDQDDLDALSSGSDFGAGTASEALFSVGPGAQGEQGTAVRTQRDCPPALPGAAPEPDADVFRSGFAGTNELLFDGNGPVGACEPAFPLGLVESSITRDDLDALDMAPRDAASAVFFSLDSASPSLAALDASPAGLLVSREGSVSVFATASALGLRPQDDLDGLCLAEDGDGRFDAGDEVLFSLRAGSPTLASMGAAPGDLLRAGNPPRIVRNPATVGLLPGDDIDALACGSMSDQPLATGDVNCDRRVNSIDAALILQYDAGLTDSFACPAADISGDGAVNASDAALILKLEAGLIDRAIPSETHPAVTSFNLEGGRLRILREALT